MDEGRGATVAEAPGRGPLVAVLETVLVGVLYYAAARLSLHAALVGTSVTPVWPPSGIALVGLLVFGRRVSPGIFLGAFLVNVTLSPPVWTAPVIAAGNTLAPLAAFELLRATRFEIRLDRKRPYELDGGDRKPTKRFRVSVEPAAVAVCVASETS